MGDSEFPECAAREQAETDARRSNVWCEEMREAKERAERERDTALAQRDDARRRYYTEAQTRIAAETALASVRKRMQDWIENGVGPIQSCGYALQHLLTSHPKPSSDLASERSESAPVAAPCAGCEKLRELCEEQDAKLRELQAKLDETRPVFDALTAAEQSNALLLRRLRFRNETIAFLTKNKIEFNENDAPSAAEDLLFYHWWVDVREWGRDLEKRLKAEEKTNKGLRRHIGHLMLTCMKLGARLHVKRAEAAHWQHMAGFYEFAEDGVRRHRDRLLREKDDNYDACHRQHEQCMNLLARVSLQLPPGEMRDLVREMLSKGELPEGTL